MNKKRLWSVTVVFFFLSFFAFAGQGLMWEAGKLRVSKTDYFDIIYGETNSITAAILYENADNIYRELAAEYGIEISSGSLSFPVVITQGVEEFNAYYTYFPYNHIVIYDTAEISDLAVFSQTLLSVFTHELTHALTYNYKDESFKRASAIFGDAFAGHYITVTSGMAEGATVSYESSKGEGRLNDPYALQMVRQAKLENKFPTYSDVKGASDAYPGGSFYYFNGAFAEFLQKTFGMHKYAEFWYRCINLKNYTAGRAFKKTFGIKIDRAWEMFKEDFYVPQVQSADPVKDGYARDFFEPDSKDFSKKNNAGSLYSDVRAGSGGLVFLDDSCNTVYSFRDGKLQKLFSHDYIDYVNVSGDSRFVTAGYYSLAYANTKHKAGVYDMQTKKWIPVEGTNIVNPVVVCSGGEYYLVYQQYEIQKYNICVQKLFDQQEKKVLTLQAGAVPSSFTELGNGSFAFIKKNGLDFSICVCKTDFSDMQQYDFPLKGGRLRELSVYKEPDSQLSLCFSWALKETLPRFGMLQLNDGTFKLSGEDVSGGVYYPVIREGQVYYTGQFFRQNRLMFRELAKFSLDEYKSETAQPQEQALPSLPGPSEGEGRLVPEQIPYKPYKSMQYAFSGLLLPVSLVSSKEFVSLGNSATNDFSLGLTYFTSLPWDSGLFMLSGGYSFSTESVNFGFQYSGGTGSNLLKYTLDSTLEFDMTGFKQNCNLAQASLAFDFGKRSMLGLSVQAEADYGRVSYTNSKGNVVKDNRDVYVKTVQAAALSYSNIIFSGPGTFEKQGLSFTTTILHNFEEKVATNPQNIMDFYDLSFDLLLYVPKLIPVICPENYTYNLPLKLQAGLFSFETVAAAPVSVGAETILLGYNIQRAVRGISALFINALTVSLQYTGALDFPNIDTYSTNWHFLLLPSYIDELKNNKFKYKDYASLKLKLGFTPNIGTFANSNARFNLYCAWNFGKEENLPADIISFGFEGKF